MTKTNIQKNLRRVLSAVLVFALFILPISIASPTQALQITGRSITLSNSAGAASGVTYTLSTAALPSATPVRSVKVQFCTALPPTGCSGPSGFTSAGSGTLPSQPTGLGATTSWTAATGTANELRITHASNVTAPSGAVTVTWNGVVNPTANNTTFYGIITTYSDSAYTTPIDSGTVALSTASQITVALAVNETLTFCAGTSITGQNCGTVTGTSVNLGTGSVSATSSGTSVLSASTNATSGYNITYTGSTLGPLTALTSPTASSVGTSQFGLNLVSNSTPAVGAAVNGSGSGTAQTGYATTNNYKFVSGNTIAAASAPTNGNTYTVSYIANIDGVTAPGSYSTAITYIATANF